MADGDDRDKAIFRSTYGIMFFGVPNQGMENSSLLAMVQDQPNETLVHNLGTGTDLLTDLHEEFCKAFMFRTSVVFSFYETRKSPTAILVSWTTSNSSFPLLQLTQMLRSTGSGNWRDPKLFLSAKHRRPRAGLGSKIANMFNR